MYADEMILLQENVQWDATTQAPSLSAFLGWKRPKPRWASYDLICMIKNHLKQSPIQWAKRHVKGHRDNHKNFQELDEWSQVNVLADQLAKAELRLGNVVEIDHTLAGQNWQLQCNRKVITGDIDRLLRNNLHESKMHKRLKMVHTIKNHRR